MKCVICQAEGVIHVKAINCHFCASCLQEANKRIAEINSTKRVLTCVYCGQEYPQDTPAWGSQVLTDHIRVCEKHPMRKLETNCVRLRKALVGLVGVDTKAELEAMEMAMRSLPMPDEDRMNTINAIHALRDTLPDPTNHGT